MRKIKNSGKITIQTILYLIMIIIIIVVGSRIYSKYNYYDYMKGVRETGKTTFTRDHEVRYCEMDSYKIENTDFNDAMFFKKIAVEPYTAYRVTCMVKTENVENQENKYTAGAQISINNTMESSDALTGTNDWQKIGFEFNSNNRTEVEIGFRLGGYEDYSKGTAWFSDFTLEKGEIGTDTNWNMVCFVLNNLDVTLENGERVQFSMSESDKRTIEENLQRFQNTIEDLSGNNMSISYDIIEIEEPVSTISYDEENEYYVGQEDVDELIREYVEQEEYDYIYVAVRLGDLNVSDEVLVHDWIGLRCNGISSNWLCQYSHAR